jgi:predicted nucleotidyltransferase
MGRQYAAHELVETVRKFLTHVEGYRIERAVVFGSRVRGDALAHSDLDVILVSPDFAGLPFPDRASEIYRWYEAWPEDYPLEVLCYTPQEFDRKKGQIGLVREAVEYGLEVTW